MISEETIKMLNIINDKIKKCMKDNNVNSETRFIIPLGAYGDFGYLTNKMIDEIIQLQQELTDYKERNKKAVEYIRKYDVFKEFSFPLMKRDEENQVKSSIQYEFDTSIKRELIEILDKKEDK